MYLLIKLPPKSQNFTQKKRAQQVFFICLLFKILFLKLDILNSIMEKPTKSILLILACLFLVSCYTPSQQATKVGITQAQLQAKQSLRESLSIVLMNLMGILRNLTLICLVFNLFDLIAPLLLFMEMFLMTALWNMPKHTLSNFYQGTFNSQWDVFSAVRSSLVNQTPASMFSELNELGLSDIMIYNLMGEIVCLGVLVSYTILIKVAVTIWVSGAIRKLNCRIPSMWNGLIYTFTPRFVVFCGYQIRGVTSSPLSIASCIISAVILVALILYAVRLGMSVRKAVTLVEYTENFYSQLGMCCRYNSSSDFHFDCLHFSTLYYIVINYSRLLISCLCIGLAPDLLDLQYGMVSSLAILYILVQISNRPYRQVRHNLFYPIVEFLLFTIWMAVFVICKIVEIQRQSIAQEVQILVYIAILLCLCGFFVSISVDIYYECTKTAIVQSPSEQTQSAQSEVENDVEKIRRVRDNMMKKKKDKTLKTLKTEKKVL